MAEDRVREPDPEARRAREAIAAPHVILYQGVFIPGRGLSAVVDAFSRLPETFHLVMMGAGGLQGALFGALAGELVVGAGIVGQLAPEYTPRFFLQKTVLIINTKSGYVSFFF